MLSVRFNAQKHRWSSSTVSVIRDLSAASALSTRGGSCPTRYGRRPNIHDNGSEFRYAGPKGYYFGGGNMGKSRHRAVAGVAMIFTMTLISVIRAAADDFQTCEKESGDVAIAACSRAIASGRYKGNNLAALYNNRCAEYNNKGDSGLAVADCNEAIRLNPEYTFAYQNRGAAYYAEGDYDRAITNYTEAIRLNPKYTDAYKSRCDAHVQQGSYSAATADCSRGGWVLTEQFVGTWNNVSTGENMTVRRATGEPEKLTIEASLSGGSYSCSYFLTMINNLQINLKLTDGDNETCLKGVFLRVRFPTKEWSTRIIGTWNNISTSKNIVVQGVSGVTGNEWENVKLTGSLLVGGADLSECRYHLTMLNENQMNLQFRNGPDGCLSGVFIRVGGH